MDQPPQEPGSFPPPSSFPPAPTPPPRSSGNRTRIIAGAVAFVVAAAGAYYFTSRSGSDPPTPEEVAAAFTPLDGYTYGEIPESALEQSRDVLASNPDTKDEIIVLDARTVNVGTQPIGAVLIMGVDSELGSDEREQFLGGFESTSGASMSEVAIGSETGYSGSSTLGPTVVFFDEDGLVFILQGGGQTDETVLHSIATQLQAANSD